MLAPANLKELFLAICRAHAEPNMQNQRCLPALARILFAATILCTIFAAPSTVCEIRQALLRTFTLLDDALAPQNGKQVA